jgi:hypothetical protein
MSSREGQQRRRPLIVVYLKPRQHVPSMTVAGYDSHLAGMVRLDGMTHGMTQLDMVWHDSIGLTAQHGFLVTVAIVDC